MAHCGHLSQVEYRLKLMDTLFSNFKRKWTKIWFQEYKILL